MDKNRKELSSELDSKLNSKFHSELDWKLHLDLWLGFDSEHYIQLQREINSIIDGNY